MGDQMYADYPKKLSLFDDEHLKTLAPHRASLTRATDGSYDVRFELISHDGKGGAHSVFATSLT